MMGNKKFHERLLTDADFSMRRAFYEESKKQAEKNKTCEWCDSGRKGRPIKSHGGLVLCHVCEHELYDTSGYPEKLPSSNG